MLFYGITPPFTATTRWSLKYIEWLKTLRFDTNYLRESFDILIDLYEYLAGKIVRINKKVVLLCRDEKYSDRIKLLCTAPGIGRLTAIEILVELQDISRFESAEELASYIGLTPSEYSTGERTRQGRITRCGNKRVRAYLVESTWILITKDPAIRLKYLKLKSTRGGKRATIARLGGRAVRTRIDSFEPEAFFSIHPDHAGSGAQRGLNFCFSPCNPSSASPPPTSIRVVGYF